MDLLICWKKIDHIKLLHSIFRWVLFIFFHNWDKPILLHVLDHVYEHNKVIWLCANSNSTTFCSNGFIIYSNSILEYQFVPSNAMVYILEGIVVPLLHGLRKRRGKGEPKKTLVKILTGEDALWQVTMPWSTFWSVIFLFYLSPSCFLFYF